MVGKTVRVTRPSRCRHLSVKVSIRCEMLPSARRSSLNRLGPSPSVLTTSTVHLSPTRASTSLTARQSSGTCRLLSISDVPSCRRRLGIYLALVSNRNQGRPVMAKVKVAVIVGSNRRDSINRKLAQALAGLGEGRLAFHFVAIDDLPLYNQDLEGELPQSVVRFKSEIAAAEAVLFITPEHNRSIPAVLKNAIDWGARPMGRTRGAESRRPSPGHRLARSERRWRNCTCDRFLEPWGPLSWAGKPTSLSSRASWMQTGRSPMRRRGDFSRLSSISSRRR